MPPGLDVSGTSNHGWFTFSGTAGGPNTDQTSMFFPGVAGYYGTIPDATNFDQNNITVETWVYFRNFAANSGPFVIARRETTNNKRVWALRCNTSGNAVFDCSVAGVVDTTATGATALSLNTWYKLQGTFDGTTVTVYVNGVSDGTAALSGNLLATDRDIIIGRNNTSGGNNLNGFLAAYAVSSVALGTFFLTQF